MRMSQLFGKTLREQPSDADTESHALLIRAGFVSQLMSGAYSFLPLGNRVRLKIENIIRNEMDSAGAQEILMPALQPLELWDQSGRSATMGEVLFQLEDRRSRALVLGPTHEEVVTDLSGKFISSYRDLPLILYQIQTKFRDEARPRGGLVRVREFTMKDAYSFDLTDDDLSISYQTMFDSYEKIFSRCGVPVVAVEADSGAIGGKGSQEFIFLSENGEDTVAQCDNCHYAANLEKAEFLRENFSEDLMLDLEKIPTPNTTTIAKLAAFLGIKDRQTAKAVMYMATPDSGGDEIPVLSIVRGDLEISEVKLSNALGGVDLRPLAEDELLSLGLTPGFTSAVELESSTQVVADESVITARNLVAGGNQKDWHYKNTNYGRDWRASIIADIAEVIEGAQCRHCSGGRLILSRGIEMGHVFRLGQVYSDAFGVVVQDSAGNSITPTMGCYGIGVGRIFAAASEVGINENGLRWPISITPYHCSLVALGSDKDESIREDAELLYRELTEAGVEVLFDDRDLRPGVMFNDADLIGNPIRLTVSIRNQKEGVVEVSNRYSGQTQLVVRESIVNHIEEEIKVLFDAL